MPCWLERRARRMVRKRKASSRAAKVTPRVTYVSVFSGRISPFCGAGGRRPGELGKAGPEPPAQGPGPPPLAPRLHPPPQCGSNLPPGHVHEHGEARHVVALAANVALVAEDDLAASG